MNLRRWAHTVSQIPPRQLAARVIFELKSRSLPRLSLPLRQYLAIGSSVTATPPLRQEYLNSLQLPAPERDYSPPEKTYTITFLNNSRELDFPIVWNSPKYSRLWQFNLHYFDWVREILTTAYRQGQIDSYSLSKLKHFISDWIATNSLCSFDGWHPYTTSLRIVNWTYATRAIRTLAKPEILASLWSQVNYLHRNKEYFAGGNHLLENLRALIVGGLNFDSPKADKIVQVALDQLEKQLAIQILPDGGHYERSPMYHLIVLNLVAESVASLESAGWLVPETILEPLERMLQFAIKIRLANGAYPLWNDAAYNVINPLDEVVSFVNQLLGQPPKYPTNALHEHLLNAAGISLVRLPSLTSPYQGGQEFVSFPDSGYYILRNSKGIELAFDCAPPCPDELPPHAQADCLTIDLYYKGQSIIVDTGTSQYSSGEIRNYERSTLAHNTVAIANQDQSEIWGSFRVGRKAQPYGVESDNAQGWQWVSAAHDGYGNPPLKASHRRWIGLATETIVILDHLETARKTEYTWNLHFAPGIELIYQDTSHYYCKLERTTMHIQVLGLAAHDQIKWLDAAHSQSWYAPEFGLRISRGVLRIQGSLPPSGKTLCTVITLESIPRLKFVETDNFASLHFSSGIGWQWCFDRGGFRTQMSQDKESKSS
ncbi:MAG: heparinase II/III family protein [Xenococcaceae cyanobacterium]